MEIILYLCNVIKEMAQRNSEAGRGHPVQLVATGF